MLLFDLTVTVTVTVAFVVCLARLVDWLLFDRDFGIQVEINGRQIEKLI